MNPTRLPLTALALGLALGLSPAIAQDAAERRNDRGDQPKVASPKTLRATEKAGDILGQNVASSDRGKLGVLKDLVVDPDGGKIVYGLVSAGGLLGIGAEVRAVPFTKFKDSYDPDGNLTVDFDRAAWDRIPPLGDDPLEALNRSEVVRATFAAFDDDPDDNLISDKASERPRLLSVTDIRGKEIVSAGQEVGQVDDVLVNLEHRRASALVDLKDDVAPTDQRLIVGFDRLNPVAGGDDRLATDFTRDQLSRAAPPREDWWTVGSTYPYVWTGYGTVAATTYSEQAVGVAPNTVAERQGPPLEGRPSATVVAGALRADTDLSENARRNISVEERNGRLVVSGTVESESVKDEVMETVKDAAEGRWQIDDRIRIRSVTE